ncbi:MAG: hypothetical protein RL368_191, partial [Pseudomonadota bacterium]
ISQTISENNGFHDDTALIEVRAKMSMQSIIPYMLFHRVKKVRVLWRLWGKRHKPNGGCHAIDVITHSTHMGI